MLATLTTTTTVSLTAKTIARSMRTLVRPTQIATA
jgi:hypothetical protein